MAKKVKKAKPTRKPTPLMKTFADITRNSRGQYHFHVKAANGEIISVGEHYTRKSSAIRGAQRAFPRVIIRDQTGEKKAA